MSQDRAQWRRNISEWSSAVANPHWGRSTSEWVSEWVSVSEIVTWMHILNNTKSYVSCQYRDAYALHVSVCPSVHHARDQCQSGWTDRAGIWNVGCNRPTLLCYNGFRVSPKWKYFIQIILPQIMDFAFFGFWSLHMCSQTSASVASCWRHSTARLHLKHL